MAVYSIIFLLLSILISGCGTANKRQTPSEGTVLSGPYNHRLKSGRHSIVSRAEFTKPFFKDETSFDVTVSNGKESQESQKLKQDLIISAMSVFLIISLLFILGCSFLHYKLVTKDNTTLMKEVKSIAIKSHSHHVETRIVLSPSQAMQLAASQLRSSQGTSLIQTVPMYKHPGDVLPLRPASNESAVSFAYTDPGTVFSASRSHTPESFLSTLSKSGSLFSMEQHNLFYGSSRSSSRESMDNPGYKYEDGKGSDDSGTTIFVPFTPM